MGDGLQFATLVTMVGKKNAARYGRRRVTIGAVGIKDGERFVMGTLSDGTVVLGEPHDFTITRRIRTKARAGSREDDKQIDHLSRRPRTVPDRHVVSDEGAAPKA